MRAWKVDELKRLLHELAKKGTQHIQWTGGEASLHPHIVELIEYSSSLGMNNSMSTNGTADLQRYQSLVKAGLRRFYISLDSMDTEFFDYMTGSRGKLNSVLATLEALVHDRQFYPDLFITLNVVLTKSNVDNLLAENGQPLTEFLRWIESLHVNDYKFLPGSVEKFNHIFENEDRLHRFITICQSTVPKEREFFYFRLNTLLQGGHGFKDQRYQRCYQSLDDLAYDSEGAYGCVIQLREGGNRIFYHHSSEEEKAQKLRDFLQQDRTKDPICRQHCFDIYRKFNDRVDYLLSKGVAQPNP
jgi:pyruvate-formate lyase-activating enzyme